MSSLRRFRDGAGGSRVLQCDLSSAGPPRGEVTGASVCPCAEYEELDGPPAVLATDLLGQTMIGTGTYPAEPIATPPLDIDATAPPPTRLPGGMVACLGCGVAVRSTAVHRSRFSLLG